MLFQDYYFKKAQWLAWHGLGMWTPQNAKDTYWLKLKTLHFHFSDQRSH